MYFFSAFGSRQLGLDCRDVGYSVQLMQQLYYTVGDETGQKIKSFEEIKEEVYYNSNFLSVHKWEYLEKNNEEKILYCQAVFQIRKDFLSLGLSKIDRVSMAKIPGYVENDRYIKSNLCFL